jgi:predicted permease
MAVTPEFFEVVGVAPARGRAIQREDVQRGCAAVLLHELWERLFRARGAEVALRVDDAPCAIVGIMPPGFVFRDNRVQLWTALDVDESEAPGNRASHGLFAIARLRDQVSLEQADAHLQSLRRDWSDRFPDHYAKGHFAVFRTLRDELLGDQRGTLLVLGGAVAFVMLIICANVAGLLVSRSEARRREFAVRRALGASRASLIRDAFWETAVIAVAGGALGLVFATWVLAALLVLYPERLPVGEAITIDYRTILFSLSLVGASAVLLGTLPALHASGVRLQDTLKGNGRAIVSGSRVFAVRSLLVAGQIALSVVLVVGGLLLLRSYTNLQGVALGFTPRGLLTFGVVVPPAREHDPAAARRLLGRIEARLAALPGVERVGALSGLPLISPGPVDDFVIEGRPDPAPGTPAWSARYVLASPAALETLGVPLKRGRTLRAGDVSGQPLVAVINETAARLYWPGDDPIGRTIRYFPRETSPSIRIVGIVGDVRSLGAAEPSPPAIYVPLAQSPRPAYEGRAVTFVVRSLRVPETLTPLVRAAVEQEAPGLPVANVRDMPGIVADTLARPRFANIVLWFFAVLALFLAALGLYGVLAYHVQQKAREIGIRMALGASDGEILRMVVRRGLVLAASGLAIGLPAAVTVTRIIRNMLHGVTPADWVSYTAVVGILSATALMASYVPARRALRVDPAVTLRAE